MNKHVQLHREVVNVIFTTLMNTVRSTAVLSQAAYISISLQTSTRFCCSYQLAQSVLEPSRQFDLQGRNDPFIVVDVSKDYELELDHDSKCKHYNVV